MPDSQDLPDHEARKQATETFDRNVVVTASAGTGKTTLLVERMVRLILASADPVSLADVVALTFMEKAANEMKVRLRERLMEVSSHPQSVSTFAAHLSLSQIRDRIDTALLTVERSQIGTIHSFAAHLIRLYPIEAGVDPRFEPDDGHGFKEHFEWAWDQWLNLELGSRGLQHDVWRRILLKTSLESLRELATQLAHDHIPLRTLAAQLEQTGLSSTIVQWLEKNRERAQELLDETRREQKEPRQVEKLLACAERVFAAVGSQGLSGLTHVDPQAVLLLKDKKAGSKPPVDWNQIEFDEACAIIDTAQSLFNTDQEFLRSVIGLLLPFAERCRRTFLETGRVGFAGLLARARDLLKDHPQIRTRLKVRFKAILVDEFQDTDPVQYEILLFLAERPDRSAATWRDIELQPGKLFIVGDPKQSIFAFRRADIEAFHDVTNLVVAQGGRPLSLSTNFRSHETILSAVNGMFSKLMTPIHGIQPAYAPLDAQPQRPMAAGTQGVECRFVAQPDEDEDGDDLTAERGVRSEAEAVAQWVKTNVIGKEMLTDRHGRPRKVQPGDIAILLRTFTQSREYLDALRRYRVPYVADGEKHFYRRQEVIDLANLLRWVQNPDDVVARLGVLRSPMGALTDREIVELMALGADDYRAGRYALLEQHSQAAHLSRLYAVMDSLHLDCPRRSLPDALDLIFHRLPVLELAAASSHGEQAVANLWKIRGMAEELVSDPALTLAGFVGVLTDRITKPPEESESGLAEESLEALHVMSIHKAKGLEFPIVILAGMQAGTAPKRENIEVHHDWSTNLVGLRVEEISTLEGVYLAKKLDARMTAERQRLLYVGMTRAKERLVLSGALTSRRAAGNFLELCRESIGEGLGKAGETRLAVGDGVLSQIILPADEGQPWLRKKAPDGAVTSLPDLCAYETRWRAWSDRYAWHQSRPLVVTPSSLTVDEAARRVARQESTHSLAATIGSLAHRILEQWSFGDDTSGLLANCDRAVDSLPGHLGPEAEVMRAELKEMMTSFANSQPYAALCRARILGREVCFLMPWSQAGNGEPRRLMEGRIDVLYQEMNGQMWIADYKTDRIEECEMADRVAAYRMQAQAYLNAVHQAMGSRPGFQLIFLRLGCAVSSVANGGSTADYLPKGKPRSPPDAPPEDSSSDRYLGRPL